jgi:hypothetical protein
MIDCPTCHRQIDGLYCRHCQPRSSPRTPPPMGFDGLRAQLRRVKRDPEADAERAAIQGEA